MIDFKHSMAAHCESGTLTNLLNHKGLEISEPLVFGISSGIFFGYMKTPMREFPTIFSRIRPGKILDNFSKNTRVVFLKKKYKSLTNLGKKVSVSSKSTLFFNI